jgi:hypothetical protein
MSMIEARVRQLLAELAEMEALNPVLLEGENWIEKDPETGQSTGRRKVGDGVTAFTSLPFEPGGGGEGGGAPDPHKTTHATGGTDALTPADIGAATAAQGALADTAVQPGNAALGDAREWTAATIEQAEAEAGTATTRRAFTAQRVFQAIAAWWAASSAKTKLDGIASGAQVNVPTNITYDAATREVRSSTGDDAVLPLVTTSAAGLQPASGYGTISYAAQVTLDFAARDQQMATISLTGALEFLSSNLANGREVRLRLVCDSTQRALTFPTDWKFVCPKPANIAASKVAVLSLAAYGTTNADVVAAYAVQP